jgi:hypothetical protein
MFDPAAAGVGIHTVMYTVTDANGCTDMDTEDIEVLSSPAATINAAGPFCENSSPVTLTANPGSGVNYWSGPGITNPATGQFSPSSAGSGSHLVTVTKTYANGCSSVGTITITVNALPNATINNVNATNTLCADGAAVTLTAATPGGTFSGPGVSGNQFNPQTAGPGSHTIMYNVTDGNGCSNNDDMVITVAPEIVITGVVTDVSCNAGDDGEIDITVTGGTPPFSYNWSLGGTTQDKSKVPVGTHTVTVTDAMGCSETASFTVGQPSVITIIPVVTTPSTTPQFTNGSIDITPVGGTPPYQYIWSNGATTEDIDNLQADMYHLTIVDAHGCRYNFDIEVESAHALGINSADIRNGLTVYPNPTSGMLNMHLDLGVVSPITVRMTDVLGRTAYSTEAVVNNTLSHAIDMSDWAAGTYILSIQVGESMVQTKVVLTR